MFEKVYYYLHRKTSLPEERGSYSAGYWEAMIRQRVGEKSRLPGGSLLEVGCGEGLFLKKYAQTHPTVALFGIDPQETLIRACKESLAQESPSVLTTLIQGDGRSLPFASGVFDTVVCMNVFLNVENTGVLEGILTEMVRVCKPGGRIVFDLRNRHNPLLRLKFKLASAYDKTLAGLPLSSFFSERVCRKLRELGVQRIRTQGLGFPSPLCPPILIFEAEK